MSVISIKVGEKYYLGEDYIRYSPEVNVLNNGLIEVGTVYKDVFGEPVPFNAYYYVPDRVGFGETLTNYDYGTWDYNRFVVTDETEVVPEQHAPIIKDSAFTLNDFNGSDFSVAQLAINVIDPDGDTFNISLNEFSSSGSFTGVLSGFYALNYAQGGYYTNGGFTLVAEGGFLESDFRGAFDFTYSAIDAFGNTGIGKVTIRQGDFSRGYLVGSDADDVLNMGLKKGAFELDGGAGNDQLIGSAGSDLLYGGLGNDRISGGRGDDVLNGGAGGDRMFGGKGNDIFVLAANQFGTRSGGLDHIIDFEGAGVSGGDVIRFTGFGADATVTHLFDVGSIQRYSASNGIETVEFMLQATNGQQLSMGDYLFI